MRKTSFVQRNASIQLATLKKEKQSMKIKLLFTCALAAAALVAPRAGANEFAGSTSVGAGQGFNGTGSSSYQALSYTDGSFDVFSFPSGPGGTAAIGGTSTQNLGKFTLGTTASNFNTPPTTFTMTVTFTIPSGAGAGTYSANVTGGVNSPSGTGGAIITWTTGPLTFTSSSGEVFTLTVNNTSVTAGTSTFVTGQITVVSVPDGGSAVALLGIALAGIEGLRRKIGARKA
jgi:hypothetical protein